MDSGDYRQLLHQQEAILSAIEQLSERVDLLLHQQHTPHRQVTPEYLSLEDASALSGYTKRTVQNILKTQRSKPDGFPIRALHGRVHAKDWRDFLALQVERRTGRGAVVQRALENLGG